MFKTSFTLSKWKRKSLWSFPNKQKRGSRFRIEISTTYMYNIIQHWGEGHSRIQYAILHFLYRLSYSSWEWVLSVAAKYDQVISQFSFFIYLLYTLTYDHIILHLLQYTTQIIIIKEVNRKKKPLLIHISCSNFCYLWTGSSCSLVPPCSLC